MDLPRWASILLLSLVLAGMLLHYPAVEADHDPYPSDAELLADYDRHVGEPIYRWGRVLEVPGDGTLVVESLPLVYDVRTDVDADPGDAIQVYGTLQADHEIAATRVIVSRQGNLLAMYAVSGVAALLTLGLFHRRWRIDLETFCVEPRGD